MLTAIQKINFETLCEAVNNGDVCLVKGRRRSDGSPVALVCAVSQDETGEVLLTPFAELVSGNPFDDYTPAWAPEAPDLDVN